MEQTEKVDDPRPFPGAVFGENLFWLNGVDCYVHFQLEEGLRVSVRYLVNAGRRGFARPVLSGDVAVFWARRLSDPIGRGLASATLDTGRPTTPFVDVMLRVYEWPKCYSSAEVLRGLTTDPWSFWATNTCAQPPVEDSPMYHVMMARAEAARAARMRDSTSLGDRLRAMQKQEPVVNESMPKPPLDLSLFTPGTTFSVERLDADHIGFTLSRKSETGSCSETEAFTAARLQAYNPGWAEILRVIHEAYSCLTDGKVEKASRK